ncbi:MAG TPA: winged helix-turn-helix domain-containing protein [Candidatus Baltobacteraceae bacterium]|nr:winged helix-turn-helix domain-containing protein [Candidatus Baltobacteraceae bacterium]
MIASRPRREELPFVGRTEEVTFLERLTTGRLPSITFVNGIGGIGKSRLLDALARRRRNAGGAVVHIDGRLVEPTEAGFYRELSRAAGGEIASCEEAAQRLAELGDVVLLVDDIDALRLLDAWLRRALVPSLPPNVHVVFSGRDPPLAAWLQTPWRGTFRSLELAPLADGDAVTLLTEAGIEPAQASRVNRIARGHPLALTLAATTLQSVDDPALEDLAFHRIVAELARRHLAEIPDPVTRRAVVAAALVRTVTAPLLGAMLPDVAPSDAYERLRTLPLMQHGRDGLKLHDSVRDAIAHELRAEDPERYVALRRACWSRLTRELRTAPPAELWRCTADLLYLLENPVVREAFFPSGAQRYAVEPARPADEAAIVAIAERHDGPSAARETLAWLTARPDGFAVARDRGGTVVGYDVLLDAAGLDPEIAANDPVFSRWLAHVAGHPVEPRERILFLRRWLSLEEGEAPSAVQAACWLDIKRTYMAHRPFLRRVYLTVRDLAPYAAAATRLGFTVLPECETTIDGAPFFTAMLDFGPGSVDGWLARLVAAELGIAASEILDVASRELVVGARRAALSPREFDTLYWLVRHAGEVVAREDLLAGVWGDDADVASNVVDVVVRSLRKKLGERAHVIETVSGIGYRFRDDA